MSSVVSADRFATVTGRTELLGDFQGVFTISKFSKVVLMKLSNTAEPRHADKQFYGVDVIDLTRDS